MMFVISLMSLIILVLCLIAFCFLRFLFLRVLILNCIMHADSDFGSSFKKWGCFSGERSCLFWVVEAFIRTVGACFLQVSRAVQALCYFLTGMPVTCLLGILSPLPAPGIGTGFSLHTTPAFSFPPSLFHKQAYFLPLMGQQVERSFLILHSLMQLFQTSGLHTDIRAPFPMCSGLKAMFHILMWALKPPLAQVFFSSNFPQCNLLIPNFSLISYSWSFLLFFFYLSYPLIWVILYLIVPCIHSTDRG